MYNCDVTEVVSKMECRLLAEAKNMDKINNPTELNKPIVKNMGSFAESMCINKENVNNPTSAEGIGVKNKLEGLAREKEVREELEKKYPSEEGYQIVSEAYLRNKDGNIVKDPVTGEARRVDFMVVKDGVVVDSIEVTSQTADKTEQTAKEDRIRAEGGNYIRDNEGNLVEIPSSVHTRIERRD